MALSSQRSLGALSRSAHALAALSSQRSARSAQLAALSSQRLAALCAGRLAKLWRTTRTSPSSTRLFGAFEGDAQGGAAALLPRGVCGRQQPTVGERVRAHAAVAAAADAARRGVVGARGVRERLPPRDAARRNRGRPHRRVPAAPRGRGGRGGREASPPAPRAAGVRRRARARRRARGRRRGVRGARPVARGAHPRRRRARRPPPRRARARRADGAGVGERRPARAAPRPRRPRRRAAGAHVVAVGDEISEGLLGAVGDDGVAVVVTPAGAEIEVAADALRLRLDAAFRVVAPVGGWQTGTLSEVSSEGLYRVKLAGGVERWATAEQIIAVHSAADGADLADGILAAVLPSADVELAAARWLPAAVVRGAADDSAAADGDGAWRLQRPGGGAGAAGAARRRCCRRRCARWTASLGSTSTTATSWRRWSTARRRRRRGSPPATRSSRATALRWRGRR